MFKSKLTIALVTILIIVLLIVAKKKAGAMSEEKKQAANPSNKIKLLASHILRMDANGSGAYGASRGGHKHAGIDLVAKVGESVFSSVGGKVKKIGLAYANDNNFKSYHIELDNGLTLKSLYVKPLFKVGDRIEAGDTIGYAQDIAGKWGNGMINHIHVEILKNGFTINPTNYLL